MSRSRKRAVSSGEDDDEDLWGEDTADVAESKPRKRTRQTSLIEDVVGDEGPDPSADADDDALDDGYDEDLYGDDDDRQHLDSLPEVEREAILYQRAEKRRELEERKAAKSSARQGRAAAGGGGRARTRQVGARGGSSLPDALADLIQRRRKITTSKPSDAVVLAGDDDDDADESPEPVRRRSQARRSRAEERSDDEEAEEEEGAAAGRGAEEDAEDEAERERRKAEARFSIPGSHTPLRLTDLKSIQLRRDRLEKVYEEPYFGDVVKGMVVRVTIGQDTKRNVPKYLVGEVVGPSTTHYTATTTRSPHYLDLVSLLLLFVLSCVCRGG